MELCRNSLFICFKTMKWRLFSSKHSLERALNSLQSNWLFQPKFSISRDSALANILRICSDITHNSQYFRNVDFSCPNIYAYEVMLSSPGTGGTFYFYFPSPSLIPVPDPVAWQYAVLLTSIQVKVYDSWYEDHQLIVVLVYSTQDF